MTQKNLTASVVIPTHNRCSLLAQGLTALSQQTWLANRFDVIVVADACEDDTIAMVTDYAKHAPYPLTLLSHAARNAAATRNLGAAHAHGDVLIFMDDDIVAAPRFIEAHIQAQAPQTIVLGYSKPVITTQSGWWESNARNWWEDVFMAMAEPGHRFTYRDFFSGNVSLSRTLFEQVCGFDEGITGRLEDYELGMRLLKAGVRFCFEKTAVGEHHDQTNLVIWLNRIRQEGVADVQIAQRHPELGTTLFGLDDPLAHPFWRLRWLRRLAFLPTQRTDAMIPPLLRLADLCETLQVYGLWQRVTGFLREYNYWRGVAQEIGGAKALRQWLQELPLLPGLAIHAPLLDMANLPTTPVLTQILAQATSDGLRVGLYERELFTIAPVIGAEPLTLAHLDTLVKEKAHHDFVPMAAAWDMLPLMIPGGSYAD